jgi:tight adherence protein C
VRLLSALPWVVASLIALSSIAMVWLVARGLGRATETLAELRERPEMEATTLPVWLRIPAALLAPSARWLGPLIPVPLRESIQELLKQAGFEELLTPPQMLSVSLSFGMLLALSAFVAGAPAWLLPIAGLGGVGAPWLWMRSEVTARRDQVIRELPIYVDMLTLALEAGGSLSVALKVATERSPDSVLRRAFQRVQGDLRAGRSRVEALKALGDRLDMPAVTPLIAALIQADSSGGSLAAVLRAQSEQRLNERFSRAEKRAMEAPVRMLGPLVLCIFPCTFLILAFPIVIRFFADQP